MTKTFDEYMKELKMKRNGTSTGSNTSSSSSVKTQSFDDFMSNLRKEKQEESKPIVSVADYESKANSWLKNSAGYLSTWEDEYTTDYFSNRKSQAAELREQGKTLLSQLEQNRSTLGDDFVNEFKSYYDEYDTHLTNYESYYNQDPYMVKYKDSSITELAKSREELLQNTSGSATAMVGLTTPSVALGAATFKKSDAALEMEALDKYQRYLTLNGGLAKNETDKIQRTAAHIENDEYYKQKEKEAQIKAESGSIIPKINMLPEGFEESKDNELDIDSDGKVSVKDATLNQLGELSDAEYYKLKVKQNKDDQITALGEKFYNAVFNEQRELDEIKHFDLSNAEGKEYNVPELEELESEYSIAQLNRYLSEEDKQALTYIIGEKVQDWYKENAQLSGSSRTQLGRYEISYENQSPFTDKLFVSELNEEINKYLAAVKGELRYSAALESFKNTEDKPLVQVIDRAALGVASAFDGVYNSLAFGNIDTADTDMEIYKQMIDEDLGERGLRLPEWLGGRTLWQSAGDLAESAGNMLPSQLLSVIPGVGPVLSSVIFGMGTGGNAKRELMKEGYDETTATIYGVCVGVAEAGLERLMGSIPGLGSKAMKQLTEGIKNGVLRAVANLGVAIVGEAIEEMSQEALEPVFRYIAGIDTEEIEVPEISDIFYAGFQGAVMSFGGNAVSTAIDVGASIKNQSSQYSKPTSADIDEIYGMVEEGLSRNKSSEVYAIAAELHNKMNKEYSKAYYRNISQGGSDTIAKEKAAKAVSKDEYNTLLKALMSENEAGGEVNDALEQRLVQLGEKGDVSVLAQAIYQYQKGVELSEAELTAIKNSKAAMKTLSEYRQAESGGFTKNWTNNVLKSSSAVKGESELAEVGAKNATTDDGVIRNRTEASSAAVKQQGGEAVSVNNVTADTAARSTELPNGVGVSLKSGSIAGIVGVEYSDGGSEARYRTSEGTVISAEEIAFDGGFEQNVIEAAPLHYSTDSANAMISAMASYKTYAQSKGAMASSAKLMSSFNDLREAGLKGITYEQASEDIHLSGDVGQIGEIAARIAINDGMREYAGKKKYSKDISDDIYYPKGKREQSAFNRSMANKTSGLKEGETKRIIINTADYVYLVTADGYLSGNIEQCISLNQNKNIVNEITREWLNNDTSDEGFDLLLETYGDKSRRHSGDSADVGYRGKANPDDVLDSQKSNSRRTRDTRSGDPNYTKGKVTVALGIKLNDTDRAILERIAKSGNVAIVIEKFSGADKYSKGFYTGGVIHLNADRLTGGGFTYTGIHESVHYVSDINHEGYKAIEKFIKNYYKEKGVDIEAEIKATQNLYKQRGKELTRSEAMEEIVCNTLSDIATDEDALTAFMGLDQSTQNSFIEALKAIVRKLKEWANKCLGNTEYHSIVINDADTLLSLAKKLRAELEKAGQKNNTAESSGDEVKYSKNIEYAQQVDDVLNNTYDKNNHVYMGNTPQTLVNVLGIKKLPLLVTNNHVYSMSVSEAKAKSEGRYKSKTNYHNLGDIVKELPKLLNKPLAIIKSNTNENNCTFVVVLNKADANGNPIVVALKPDGKGNYYNVELDSTVLLSTYGKDNFLNYLNTAWKENRILYVNKNSQKNNTIGVQFPNNIMSADYSNNLARFKQIVNTKYMQESSKKKHLFASTKAKTVNDSLYQQAVKLYESGESKSVIWQETGWFRGYDGKWRFEIDDSKAEFRVGGDAMQLGNPEYNRWADLLLSEKRTEAEEHEFNKLNEKFSGDFWNDKNSLQDYLIHDELYEAYPQLKDIEVVCFPMSMKVGGRYNITTDTIYLNSLLDEQELMETLFHELQHKIQSIEGLAKGASTEYWQKKIDEGFDSRTADVIEEEQKLMAELKDIIKNDSEFYLDMVKLSSIHPSENVKRAEINWDTLEKTGEDPIEWQRYDELRDKLIKKYGENKVFHYMFLEDDLMSLMGKGRTATELYYSTAGEIEARNVASRLKFNKNQRKNALPNIDSKDVVFAEDVESYSIHYTDNGEPVLVVNDDILRDARTNKEIVDIVKQYIGRIKKVPIRGHNIFFTSKTKDEYVNSKYTNKLKNKDNQKYLDKMRMAAHPYDIIYATTDYVNEAPKHKRKDNLIDFSRGKLLADISGRQYTADVVIGFTKSGICVLYDIVSIQPTQFEYKKEVTSVEGMDSYESTRSDITSSKDSISNNSENVNKKSYSFGEEDLDFGLYLSEDSEVAESLKNSNRAMGAMVERTAGAELDVVDVSRVMKKNLKDFGIKGDIAEANERVFDIISIAQRADFVDGGDVVGEIAVVMKNALRNSLYVVDDFAEERKDILSRIKGVGRIYLTADQIAMLKDSDYSLNWFKQKMFGKVTVVANPKLGENIESLNGLWHTLSEDYPQWFSADTLSDNMPLEMIKALESLKPQSVGADEYFMRSNDEIAIELANKVLSDIIDLKYRKLHDESIKAEVRRLKAKQSDSMKKWLLNKEAGDKIKSIERCAASFYRKLTKPTKNQSIPENLRVPMLELLEALDFVKGTLNYEGKTIKHDLIWQQRMLIVADALKSYGGLQSDIDTEDLAPTGDKVRGFEVDARLVADLKEFSNSTARRVYDMTDEEILNLNSLMYRLRNEISQLNKLNANKYKKNVQELGQATISELENKGEIKALHNKASRSLFYSTADALTYFSLYGEAGMSVYEELREGYDKYILNVNKVREFAQNKLDEKKIKKWSKEVHQIDLLSGETVYMTTPQIMNLYLLNNRQQARGHLYDNPDERGRIKIAENSELKGQYKNKSGGVIVIANDVAAITAKLTAEQRHMADVMQEFLENEIAEMGNEVTMRRYLYRAFTTGNYWPIKVDGSSVDTTDSTASLASFYAVANPGFSKQTQEGAHNPLIIGDVFDVFSEHCGNMAMFNGMSEALSDAMRWYNFRNGDNSVKGAIETAFSKEAQNWFETFVQDLNGRGVKAGSADAITKAVVRQTKSALIWGNMKVVVQQPTAYLRAANVLNPKYLAQAVATTGGTKKALEHCPTAMWKNWGFYATDVGKSMRNLILNDDSLYDKARSAGFYLAGKADELTWGKLWNACELQVLGENKNVSRQDADFNEKVAALLRQVIDETQVVDTPFHRSQIRRDTSATAQMMSAFMDEPIKSYNMFMKAILSGDGKKIARAAVTYTVTVVFGQALVKALWDLLIRYNFEDDEDGERKFDDFLRLWAQNAFEDLNPVNMRPYLSKVWSIAENILHNVFPECGLFSGSSYTSASLDTTYINDINNFVNRIMSLVKGEDSNRTWYGYVYDISKVLGDISGIGVNRVMQDIVGVINNFLPVGSKITKTDYSNTYIAGAAVNALMDGDSKQYKQMRTELTERTGSEDKAQRLLANALSMSGAEAVKKARAAADIGDKTEYDKAYNELIDMGFEHDVVVMSTRSLKSDYNTAVQDAAEAIINGDDSQYNEAISWLMKYDFPESEYSDDISEAEENLRNAELEEADAERMYDNEMIIAALNSGDYSNYNTMLEHELEKSGTSKSSFKSAVTRAYKGSYYTAYTEGNNAEMSRIESIIVGSGLYVDKDNSLEDVTRGWVVSCLETEYKNACSLGDTTAMQEIRARLWDTGKWSSLAKLDERLKKLKESEQGK